MIKIVFLTYRLMYKAYIQAPLEEKLYIEY